MKIAPLCVLLFAVVAAYNGCRSGKPEGPYAGAAPSHSSETVCGHRADNDSQPLSDTDTDVAAAETDEAVGAPLTASPIANEVRLTRTGYTVSYNVTTRQPNYVAWKLTPQRLRGKAKRSDSFAEDETLPESERAWLSDYYNSGYDRGHMCPAGDNKWSVKAMNESFLLSNVCPQRHTLNSGGWNALEQTCRKWVKSNAEPLYIIAGPIFDNRTGYTHKGRRVCVPDRFFKALVCIGRGREKGIAFIYANNAESQTMEDCVTTIDRVEEITGYDLFYRLDKTLQKKIEAQSDLYSWQ